MACKTNENPGFGLIKVHFIDLLCSKYTGIQYTHVHGYFKRGIQLEYSYFQLRATEKKVI